MTDMTKLIETEIDKYIEKYATKHHISIEEAKQHIMVKLAEEYYKGRKND